MEAAPYDNVEFGPVGRKAGTGTWPGPQGPVQNQPARTLQQSSATKGLVGAGGARLAPLEESAEMPESHDQRMQAVTQHASSFAASSQSQSATSSTSHVQRTGGVGGGLGVGGTSSGNAGSKLLTMSTFGPTSTTQSSLATTTAAATTTTTPSYKSTTTTATSNNNKAAADKTAVVKTTVSAPTYMLTQVGSGGVKDATSALRSSDDDDDFKRHDLDPPSRAVLEAAYSLHKEFYRLNSKILDEGALLKQDVLDIYRKSGEAFSYEQLLQGMLVDGEMLLLGGCWLHYMHVEFKDETGERTVRQPYGRGRLCLTSHRVLLLSADVYTDADLNPYGDSAAKNGGYKLEVSKRSAVVFRNLPLACFHSADLEVNIGTSAQTKISASRAPCCGLCGSCFACGCCGASWHSTPPMTRSFNERVVRMGVALPPWGTRAILVLHLDPGQSLTTARDFIAQLHQHSPNMQ